MKIANIVPLFAALCLAASGAVASARAADGKQGGQSTPGSATSPAGRTFTNSIGMEFVLIPAGTFMMGCDESTGEECEEDEKPRHEVTISRPFYLGKYEVTRKNAGTYTRTAHSTEYVSYNESQCPDCPQVWPYGAVQDFISGLNKLEGHNRYRLPTEAEWEYAARAGTTTAYHFGNDKEQLKEYAWYEENSNKEFHRVGEKLPNPWGLYDMYGNLWEWTQDKYDQSYYKLGPAVDPRGPESISVTRVLRGGNYASCGNVNPGACRSAKRAWKAGNGTNTNDKPGFRLVLEVED